MSDTTCTHHNDAERIKCPVCLVTALTAERDELRFNCNDKMTWAAHYLAQSIEYKARADKAEAALSDPQQLENSITFHCGQAHQEIMRLDKDGMTYKGQRIEDAGEAHRALLEVLSAMREAAK